MDIESKSQISEVLPKSGIVLHDTGKLSEVLCKPKILPIKSKVIKKLEEIEREREEEDN
jgi:hypothetical protein